MEENQISITALVTAFARAYHSLNDTPPKIFDDFLARRLFTEKEYTDLSRNLAEALMFFDPELAASCPNQDAALARMVQKESATLSRSRYTEDILKSAVQQGVSQYIILGAGLDTFSFRHSNETGLKVFEVDHPSMQAFKRRRLDELGWTYPAQLHFVPLDFTQDTVAALLNHPAYDPRSLTFFSWLGVTFYLTRDAVFSALRRITEIAPAGSMIVFDYLDTDAFDPAKAAKRTQKTIEITRRAGEPMITGFDPSSLAADLEALGLHLHENLSPAEIERRCFQGRKDNYHAAEHIHYAWAIVS